MILKGGEPPFFFFGENKVSMISVLLIALGLSMDALAVSITVGVTLHCFKPGKAFKTGLFFGGFQAIMPLLGWFAGLSVRKYIEGFDHWLAFGLLSFIGGKMIYEAFVMEEAEKKCDIDNLLVMFGLALATSIDALAVGISFSLLSISILTPVIIIGLVTFALSFIGVYVGNKFGSFFEKKVEIFGGIVLIGIGVKILLEHLL